MKIDRDPIDTEIRQWNLSKAIGKLYISEEKLIWIPDNELNQLYDKIDDKILQEVLKLKEVILFLDTYLKEKYHFKDMNEYEKVLVVYNFINTYIRFPLKYMDIVDGKEILKPNHPDYILEPFGTWINKEGLSEGQARLMVSLLNNPIINIDATTIKGETPQGKRTWVGIVIKNKLYQCCTTIKDPFRNLDELGYVINESMEDNQIYPSIYEHAYLSEEEIKKIDKHVKSLRR